MTKAEAIARLQQGLGFRGAAYRSTEILAWIIEAQRELERGKTLPWFLWKEDQPLTLAIGANTIALPSDFLRLGEDERIRFTPSGEATPTRVIRRGYDDAIEALSGTDAGGPQVYVLRSSSLYILPAADVAYSLTWSYWGKGDDLATNNTNVWLDDRYVPTYLIGYAGVRAATDLRDESSIKVFSSMFSAARSALLAEVVDRELAGEPLYIGSDN